MNISVCIPLYNGKDCLENALESLVNQTRKPDEIVIRDDCSTDGGVAIVEKFRSLNIDLKINKKNLGMIGNWNKCLEDSQGDLVTFLHQDDGYEPNFLLELETDFQNDKKIGLWACQTYVKGQKSENKYLDPDLTNEKDLLKKIYTWEYIPAPTAVSFRKTALLDVGFYDSQYKYVAEPDLYFRLISNGYLMFSSNKTLAWRTLPETRATSQFGGSDLYYNEWLYFLEKFSFGNSSIDEDARSIAFSNFYEKSIYSSTSMLINLHFKEASKILKTVFSRGRNFERLLKQKNIGYKSLLFLMLKSSSKIFYFFLRHNIALTYRSIKGRFTYN